MDEPIREPAAQDVELLSFNVWDGQSVQDDIIKKATKGNYMKRRLKMIMEGGL